MKTIVRVRVLVEVEYNNFSTAWNFGSVSDDAGRGAVNRVAQLVKDSPDIRMVGKPSVEVVLLSEVKL